MPTKPEAFSRVLIDQALRESNWDLLDDRHVRFELDGKSGRADYALSGERGLICVLEAKRPDLDPYEAWDKSADDRPMDELSWHIGVHLQKRVLAFHLPTFLIEVCNRGN